MKCPSCGSENEEAALCCTLCSIVLPQPKEPTPPPKPAPAPAPAPAAAAPGEPARLDGPDAQRALIALAQERMLADDLKEAARLMTRLFLEVSPGEAEYLLMTAGEDWLKEAYLGVEEETTAREGLAAAGKAAGLSDFASAHAALKQLFPLVKLDLTPGWRFVMFTLGLKGAAGKKRLDQ